MDRRIGFIKKGPSGRCKMRSTQTSMTQLHAAYSRTARKRITHSNYSPNLHLSPRVSSPPKEACSSSASERMLWMTADGDGVAPSKTMSFRCIQRHQHTRATPVQKSRTSTALPRQDCNQSVSKTPCGGSRSSLSHQRRQEAHTALANTQPSNRWVMNS
jgi:hypothetical protein